MPESNEIENDKLKNRSEFSETVHAVIPRVRSDKRNTGWHLPTKKPGAAMNPYLFGRSPFRKASARKHAPQTLARTSVLNSRCSPRIRLLKYPNRYSAPTTGTTFLSASARDPAENRAPLPRQKTGSPAGPPIRSQSPNSRRIASTASSFSHPKNSISRSTSRPFSQTFAVCLKGRLPKWP